MTHTETTATQSSAERAVRAFVAEFPTPHALQALAYCESGQLAWTDVEALFKRSLVAALTS